MAKAKTQRQKTTRKKLDRPASDVKDNPNEKACSTVTYHDWLTEAGLERLRVMAFQSWTDAKIADTIGINERTLRSWRQKYEPIRTALKKDKLLPAMQILRSFEQNSTTGYEWDEVTTFESWDAEAGCWVMKDRKTVHKFRPPETTAQIFGLKNLLPEHFRDRVELQQDVAHIDDGFTAAMDKAAEEVFDDGIDTPANIDD